MSCVVEKFSTCSPKADGGEILKLSLEIMESFQASPYDVAPLAIAFGADPREARRFFNIEVSGSFKKPVWTFLINYGRRYGYEKVEKALLKLYDVHKGGCICPVGPVVPLGDGRYITQRPYGIYICGGGHCVEVAPEPITVYEHPDGCMLYSPPIVLTGQPMAAVVNTVKQLKAIDPEAVAFFLLPGLCKDLWGVDLL
ncbi:MAG: hypothetical protein QXT46_01270 [Pyrobaculum sp.]